MARGYGIANYGDGYWGETKYVDAVASASASASPSASGQKIKLGLAQKSAQSSASASANFTTNSGGSVTSQVAVTTQGVRVQFSLSIIVPTSTNVASCERVRPTSAQTIAGDSYLAPVATIVTAGGSADIVMASGSSASGNVTSSGSSTTGSSASLSSAGLIVKDGDVTDSVSASGSSSANITASGLSGVSGSVIGTANSAIIAVSSATVSPIASAVSQCVRVRFGGGSTVISTLATASTGREQWESIGANPATWVELDRASNVWQDIA